MIWKTARRIAHGDFRPEPAVSRRDLLRCHHAGESKHPHLLRQRHLAGRGGFTNWIAPAFDPGLFIESDGTAYIATSGGWDGHVTLLKLSADLSQVVDARGILYYKGIEGSKVIKRGGWYYIFNALPSQTWADLFAREEHFRPVRNPGLAG